ncbi:DSBA-like thioredoxin domain-containing protein [Herbihabitans rhizosphaerae]|uniref:DSBA-like thioredoxin domain-containing protein n=1 Tax=Herbihabitans rhizosphaerae TaxID=1872711 RepID=A0A4Q7KJL9_9PSEU|nr:DsbA family protein [Herbihabitans rhizosphaerae]RZS36386.1 DSBA-like thioredoxin domain-containing protein [Herbihabitans rhizosphaerae]
MNFAREIGLDLARFEADLDDQATAARVLKDQNDGIELGVQGTPTFFVNGAKFSGQPSYKALKNAVAEELAK